MTLAAMGASGTSPELDDGEEAARPLPDDLFLRPLLVEKSAPATARPPNLVPAALDAQKSVVPLPPPMRRIQ